MSAPISIELTHVAATGEAIGRDEDGRVVFVADAIPGETVEVEIVAEAKRWRRGTLRKVLKASADQVTAPCPHFGPPQPVALPDSCTLNEAGAPRCAGCLWQHIDYERQLALKREIVVDTLTRDGRPGKTAEQSRRLSETLVAEVVAIGARESEDTVCATTVERRATVLDFGFRTQMRFGVGQSGQLTLAGRAGERLAVDGCPLHHPQLAQLFAGFSVDKNEDLSTAVNRVTLAVGGTADSLSDRAKGVLILHSQRDEPPGLELDLPVNVFLLHEKFDLRATVRRDDGPSLELLVGDWAYSAQVDGRPLIAYPPIGDDIHAAHLLAEEVLAAVAAELLELKTFEHLLELWAGSGARATLLADQVATIVSVEEAEPAVAALRANLAALDNADAWQGAILPTIRKLRRAGYGFDAVLLTPPHGVIDPELFSLLTRMRIRRCGLITDDPLSLARSLAAVDEAGYRLTAVQPIDLQPHQPEVTLVARFDRK